MPDSSNDIGIGIVGSGFMAMTYAEVTRNYLEGARLVSIFGGSRAPKLAEQYQVQCHKDIYSLVNDPGVQAVLICSPHDAHEEAALLAIQAGRHVMVEKPMAPTVKSCDAINQAANSAGVKVSVAFTQRPRVVNREAKKLIDSGRIGKVLQIHFEQFLPSGLDALPNWQSKPDNLGTLFGYGIHAIDAIRWLSCQEVKEVYALRAPEPGGKPVEANSILILNLQDGAVATLASCFDLPKPGFPRTQFFARVIGERGLLEVDAYNDLRASIDGGSWETVTTQPPIDWQGKGALDPNRLESFTLFLQDFIDAIREDRQSAITGHDGRQAVAIALAAYESQNTGKPVAIQ